jgi:glycosyltransferase involved in cell wall biosynthesis
MISIVIPAFNEEKLIRECLESLKKQDFTGAYEVIVVDNGSQDNTAKIASEMGVKVIACSRKGVSYARQSGAEIAKGEIIVQADADTIYPSWWLSHIQRQFSSHPKAIAVAGKFVYKNPPWWGFMEYFLRVTANLLSALILGRPLIISGANFAFRKKALMKIGGYDQNAYSSDQYDISTRLSQL